MQKLKTWNYFREHRNWFSVQIVTLFLLFVTVRLNKNCNGSYKLLKYLVLSLSWRHKSVTVWNYIFMFFHEITVSCFFNMCFVVFLLLSYRWMKQKAKKLLTTKFGASNRFVSWKTTTSYVWNNPWKKQITHSLTLMRYTINLQVFHRNHITKWVSF